MCLFRPSVRSEAKPSSGGSAHLIPAWGGEGHRSELKASLFYSMSFRTARATERNPVGGGGMGVGGS